MLWGRGSCGYLSVFLLSSVQEPLHMHAQEPKSREHKQHTSAYQHQCTRIRLKAIRNGLTGKAAEAEETPQEVNSLLKTNEAGRRRKDSKIRLFKRPLQWHFHFSAGLPAPVEMWQSWVKFRAPGRRIETAI
ncbi:guanine nucleotide-binding protein G(I)/G(S)/G(O) subunit gamma-2 isoform X1 [Labeo rohita]|uniref:guanine nucleotide-binding protein G(I)/G(S)/G(O) subunit gamma-2 isoform X1 n=1 Tax=Labeo rohita TaxID=84645 RepID=UPI0021E3277F|nr:guanine nucleotide-binding protein G(I)/G(S)/G(O) subunit gamma-2 isoform X1 [Labeo rohita]